MTRHIIIVFLILFSLSAEAQFGGGRGGGFNRPTPNTLPEKLPEVNIERMAGFLIYDIEKTTKKVGVKKSHEYYDTFVDLLKKHNKDQQDIIRINSFTLNQAKDIVVAAQKETQQTKNFANVQVAFKKTFEMLKPMIDISKESNDKLDKEVEKILSKKQLKKWKSYKNRKQNSRK